MAPRWTPASEPAPELPTLTCPVTVVAFPALCVSVTVDADSTMVPRAGVPALALVFRPRRRPQRGDT